MQPCFYKKAHLEPLKFITQSADPAGAGRILRKIADDAAIAFLSDRAMHGCLEFIAGHGEAFWARFT